MRALDKNNLMVTLELLSEQDWSYKALSGNPSISIKYVLDTIDIFPWNSKLLASNPALADYISTLDTKGIDTCLFKLGCQVKHLRKNPALTYQPIKYKDEYIFSEIEIKCGSPSYRLTDFLSDTDYSTKILCFNPYFIVDLLDNIDYENPKIRELLEDMNYYYDCETHCKKSENSEHDIFFSHPLITWDIFKKIKTTKLNTYHFIKNPGFTKECLNLYLWDMDIVSEYIYWKEDPERWISYPGIAKNRYTKLEDLCTITPLYPSKVSLNPNLTWKYISRRDSKINFGLLSKNPMK